MSHQLTFLKFGLRKGVGSVFSGGSISFCIVNTNPPSRLDLYRCQLILIISNHGDVGLFKNNLDRTNPLIVGDMIHDLMV